MPDLRLGRARLEITLRQDVVNPDGGRPGDADIVGQARLSTFGLQLEESHMRLWAKYGLLTLTAKIVADRLIEERSK